jgi:hypothetical protein
VADIDMDRIMPVTVCSSGGCGEEVVVLAVVCDMVEDGE